MRDIFVTLIVLGSLPMTFMRPYIGVVMWFLVSYMNFHRMSYGFAYTLPVAMMVGVATLGSWAITKEKHPIPKSTVAILLGAFFIWTVVTTVFAVGDEAPGKLMQFFKIVLMTYVTISLMQTPQRLGILIWVTFISLGYFSVKGGLFTIATGGSYRVWGPPDTFVEDNNALAMALLMILPLIIYLAKTVEKKRVRQGLYGCAFLTVVSVIGSYSRGAFLALIVLAGMMWWRSKNRLGIGVAGIILIAIGTTLVPQSYYDRINTLNSYEEDGSATGRLDIWAVAIDIAARRPITGGGFYVHNTNFAYVNQRADFFHKSFHSIYFEVLAYHGYVGLLLFLALGAAAYRSCTWMQKQTKNRPDLQNQNDLARMLQCCLISYFSAGAFQNLAHYDLYYGLLAIIIISRHLLEQKLRVPAPLGAHQPVRVETGPATPDDDATLPVPAPAGARSFLRSQSDIPADPRRKSFLRS